MIGKKASLIAVNLSIDIPFIDLVVVVFKEPRWSTFLRADVLDNLNDLLNLIVEHLSDIILIVFFILFPSLFHSTCDSYDEFVKHSLSVLAAYQILVL